MLILSIQLSEALSQTVSLQSDTGTLLTSSLNSSNNLERISQVRKSVV